MTTHNPPSLTNVMTPFPYAVSLDASVDEAERLIAAHDYPIIFPVKDQHDIVGIVTSRDLMLTGSGKRRRRKLLVEDVCVKDIYVVDLREPPRDRRFDHGGTGASARRSLRARAGLPASLPGSMLADAWARC